jgi:hypothetical protein
MNSPLAAPAPLPSPVLPNGLAALRTFAASRDTLLIGSLFSPRPFAPLSKSFRINTVTNSPQNPPPSNSFKINHFQTSREAPLSKSFRMITLQKDRGWGSNYIRTSNFRPSTLDWSPNYKCFLSLTKKLARATKRAQCFLSLTSLFSRNYLCFLSLPKKGGGRGGSNNHEPSL